MERNNSPAKVRGNAETDIWKKKRGHGTEIYFVHPQALVDFWLSEDNFESFTNNDV